MRILKLGKNRMTNLFALFFLTCRIATVCFVTYFCRYALQQSKKKDSFFTGTLTLLTVNEKQKHDKEISND